MVDPARSGSRTPRYALPLVAATIGIAVGLGAALLHSSHAPAAEPGPLHAQVTWPAGTKPAPAFSLPDERGETVSLRSLRGHPVVVTFLDSRCRRECPIEGRVLRDALPGMSATGAVLLVVSVDPWADTRASARAFAARAGWRDSWQWHWLLGRERALARVWRAYHIAVKRASGDILHSAALYVVDSRGDLRAGYLFPFSAKAVASDVRRLAETS